MKRDQDNLIWNILKLEFKTRWEHPTVHSLTAC